MMKVAMACDHGAYEYKDIIKEMLIKEGYEIVDFGCDGPASVDYPDYAKACANAVANKEVDCGIVMCGTGIGISIACNKVKGIRCALCCDTTMAKLTREHNDANILSIGQRTTGIETVKDIVHVFLETPFSGLEKHAKRIEKIKMMEE